jgi:hypothetical protein
MSGPNYHRPAVLVPQAFRAPSPLPAPQASSLADLKWCEVFRDEKLQGATSRATLFANKCDILFAWHGIVFAPFPT